MSKRKLLLADDSITIQKVVNLTFADEGIEVVSVGDGDAAMQKFNEAMPDLVLADVNMPGLDGYRMCEMIKQDDETKHIPVILLVGSFEPFDEQEAWRVGADDFLTKPFQSIRQLVTKVSDLLNPAAKEENKTVAAPASNEWQFADTKEFPAQETADKNLGDAGMDDEMIETSQVGEPMDDVQKFISESYSYGDETEKSADSVDLVEKSFQNEADNDFAILEPTAETEKSDAENRIYEFSDYEIKADSFQSPPANEVIEVAEIIEIEPPEPNIFVNAENIENTENNEPQAEYENDRQFKGEEKSDIAAADREPESFDYPAVSDNFQTEAQAQVYVETPETEEETETLETPEVVETSQYDEETYAEIRAEEETENQPSNEYSEEKIESSMTDEFSKEETETSPSNDFSDESAADSHEAERTEFTEVAEPEQSEFAEVSEIEPAEEKPAAVNASGAFDEFDFLELPPLIEETGIRPQPKAEVIEPQVVAPETLAVVETEPKITLTKTVAESEIALSFPPELIEAIAQKVAEKISDRAILQIADELVPQMSDLIVKKLAEEIERKK